MTEGIRLKLGRVLTFVLGVFALVEVLSRQRLLLSDDFNGCCASPCCLYFP